MVSVSRSYVTQSVSRSYVTRLFEIDTDFKNVFMLKFYFIFSKFFFIDRKNETKQQGNSILHYINDEVKKEPSTSNVELKKRAILFTLDKNNPKKLSALSSGSKKSTNNDRTSTKEVK